MRKHLFVTLLLACGMPGVAFTAMANPEPQTQSQAAVTIKGTVLDENNEPVIGASVTPKGTTMGVSTDAFGNFTLKVAPGAQLTVAYVGYKTETVKAADGMTVYLQPTTEMLNEVVAIGYGSQKRANLTGAVATVDVAKVMDGRPSADVAKSLQGAVPGLTITTNDGAVNSTARLKIRGTGTLSNGQVSNPLIVVDGVPVDDLSFVNPDDIENISVLKDAASSSIYGTRAAFGVILITTKKAATQDRVSVKYTNNFAWSRATTLPEYSSVPNQLRALMQSNNRQGVANELFGMYFEDLMPYAEAWEKQNGGKAAGYREMLPFQDWDNVGDYYVNADGSGALYYANWDVAGIMFRAAPSNKHNVSVEGQSGKTNYRISFGYDRREGTIAFNAPVMKRYNASANINTEIFDWWKAGVRFTYADKVYNGNQEWRSPYVYGWRWGSYFGPYGYMKAYEGRRVVPGDPDYDKGVPVQCNAAVGYAMEGGQYEDDATDTRIQAYTDINPFKGFTLHADFTYDRQNYNCRQAWMPIEVWNTWNGNINYVSTQRGTSGTSARETNSYSTLWTVNVYGTYEHTFIDNLNFKLMAGGTAERFTSSQFYADRDVLLDVNLPYLGLTSGGDKGDQFLISNTRGHRATAGFFGRLNLDWKGIYLFEFNGRYDGSSRFPATDQWAFFPSGSVGYRFTEENYFKNLNINDILSNGKLRASYGHIGNEAIGTNMFISTIGTGSLNWLTGGSKTPYAGMPSLVSSSLTWERVVTTDIGLDLGFLNNSLNLTFDWFQRDTKDMLAPSQTQPAVLGASAPMGNNGSLRTRGWELGINWNHSFGDADVYANFNIYDGKTKVTSYRNDAGLINNFYDGKNYGEIWGFETDRYFEESDFQRNADGSYVKDSKGNFIPVEGVADQRGLQQGSFKYGPGDIKFADLDGDGVISGGVNGRIELDGVLYDPGDPGYDEALANPAHKNWGLGTLKNHGDLKVIGNATPRYEYSFRLGGAWKGFDIDMFFQGVGKRDWWSTSAFVMPLTRGADATYANQESYNKMIFDENNKIVGYEISQANDYPCMYPGSANTGTITGLGQGRYNFYPQTKYLMNMAYLRFKTLTVGYTLPANLTQKALIQKARVYFTAENLCLLYNGMKKYPIDPEIGSNWTTGLSYSNGTFGRTEPMNRTFSFGLQITL